MDLLSFSWLKYRGGIVLPSCAIVVGGFLAGCQVTDNHPSGTRQELAISASIQNTTFTDATGKIRIRVKRCDTTAAATTNCAYCTVDDGWARIGGGASIVGENTPGAMLQASFPSPDPFLTVNSFGCTGTADPREDFRSTWVVRASGAVHRLVPYVIEMQLVDPYGNAFLPRMTDGIDGVADEVDPPDTYSVDRLESDLPAGYFLIGGGGTVFTDNPANTITAPTDAYLVESRPVDGPNGRAWRATARAQHKVVYDEPLKTYMIGAERCPSQWEGHCFTYPMIQEITAAATTGYGTAPYSISPSWIGSSVGGYAPTTNSGPRYLADLIPFNGTSKGFTVRSKGNGTMGSGSTIGTTLVFGTDAGFYYSNSINFTQAGVLYRPSGTNPQLQQSVSAAYDLPATRWTFEPFGTGYRLRNGNPDAGGECAYRDGTTANVRVAACGTGSQFLWTFLDDPTTTAFQLKNASNGKCLDWGTGGSGVSSNLVLKTCATDLLAPQHLYLDRANWPR